MNTPTYYGDTIFTHFKRGVEPLNQSFLRFGKYIHFERLKHIFDGIWDNSKNLNAETGEMNQQVKEENKIF